MDDLLDVQSHAPGGVLVTFAVAHECSILNELTVGSEQRQGALARERNDAAAQVEGRRTVREDKKRVRIRLRHAVQCRIQTGGLLHFDPDEINIQGSRGDKRLGPGFLMEAVWSGHEDGDPIGLRHRTSASFNYSDWWTVHPGSRPAPPGRPARAASGHAIAAPPRSVMNSRRFIRSPRLRVAEAVKALRDQAPWRPSD